MSVEVKTYVKTPFDWLNEDDWSWIADYAGKCEYSYLDHIYWCLCEGRGADDFRELEGLTIEEMKEIYRG